MKKAEVQNLKSPDFFVSTSDKLFNFIEHHFKVVVSLVGLVLIVSVSMVSYTYIKSSQEQKAAEALYAPEASLRKLQVESKAPTAAKTPPDYAKDYAPLVAKIKAEISAHADTKAALVSSLNLAYLLAEQAQFADALTVLDLPKYRPTKGDILEGFWYMHRGLMLLENQKYEAATEAYQAVLSSPELKPFHPESLLKMGVSLGLKGESAKARETYERLGREFPESEASATAQQYLRLLELKK